MKPLDLKQNARTFSIETWPRRGWGMTDHLVLVKAHLTDIHRAVLFQVLGWRVNDGHVVFLIPWRVCVSVRQKQNASGQTHLVSTPL